MLRVLVVVVRTRGRVVVAGLDAARRQVWMGSVGGIVVPCRAASVGVVGELVLRPSHWRLLGGEKAQLTPVRVVPQRLDPSSSGDGSELRGQNFGGPARSGGQVEMLGWTAGKLVCSAQIDHMLSWGMSRLYRPMRNGARQPKSRSTAIVLQPASCFPQLTK